MRDAKTKTRIQPGKLPFVSENITNLSLKLSGAYDYTAPEIIDAQSYDEKSDIWSIGAILLDICTTSLYDVSFILK